MNKFFLSILIIGVLLRFYNIAWGAPFYFHPDERQNIAYPIQDSKSPLMRDQKNFDINPFPLIVIKGTYQLISKLPLRQEPVELTILISRLYSALFSILISIILYFIGKKFWNRKVGFIAFTLSVFSTGLIQYSHFGTIEMWEGLILLLLFYISADLYKSKKIFLYFLLGVTFGLGISIKFLILAISPIIIVPFIPLLISTLRKRNKNNIITLLRSLYLFLIGFVTTILVFFPQLFLNFHQIEDSLKFESTVATGKLPVFFTQGFINTYPLLYQIEKVLPFLLNPFILIFSLYAVFYLTYKSIKKREVYTFLLLLSFLIPFISTSFLFVKWTRYMIPVLPFLYIINAIFLYEQLQKIKNVRRRNFVLFLPVIVSIIFSLSFFVTVYLYPHTTVAASTWFDNKFKYAKSAISESFDIGITPFNPVIKEINLIDFYSIESNDIEYENLQEKLQATEFVILPSQRVLKSRLLNPSTFPRGFAFYNLLLNNRNSFKLIYKTPCNVICKIAYVGDPIYSNEETVTVFDRPSVFIFKKIK